MKLNQNKKDEILQLDSCSKNLLIWIQLQALQEDKIECTYSLYSKDVKVSLNTFKKALGGLLDSRILYATSSKGWYSLNKDFIADSYFYHNGLGDFNKRKMWVVEPSKIPIIDYNIKSQMVDPEYINNLYSKIESEKLKIHEQESLVKLKPEIVEKLKTESVEDIKKDLLKSKEGVKFQNFKKQRKQN
jgi:hypothetical protein